MKALDMTKFPLVPRKGKPHRFSKRVLRMRVNGKSPRLTTKVSDTQKLLQGLDLESW